MFKNAKFSRYYFYMNTNKYGDFQIYNSVPLRNIPIFLKGKKCFPILASKQHEIGIWKNRQLESKVLQNCSCCGCFFAFEKKSHLTQFGVQFSLPFTGLVHLSHLLVIIFHIYGAFFCSN